MPLIDLEHFFKPETRNSGHAFVTKDKVTFSQPSDTEVQSYVRASTAYKVSLKYESFDSPNLFVDCTCPSSKKGQFCKHMWAALLKIDQKNSEFLDSKLELKRPLGSGAPVEELFRLKQESYKLKQANYRKEQYQKQKERAKTFKAAKKNAAAEIPSFPLSVEKALQFFEENGFSLRECLTEKSVALAMRKLSRVFHPDRGGTHEEFLELNANAELLLKYATK